MTPSCLFVLPLVLPPTPSCLRENEIGAFAAQHADYPREKFVDILRKTWRKMSPAAQAAALALDLPPAIAGLVREAVTAPQA